MARHEWATPATYASDIIQGVEFGGQSTVDTEELLVHHRGQGQVAERVHTGVVDDFAVLVFACKTRGLAVL